VVAALCKLGQLQKDEFMQTDEDGDRSSGSATRLIQRFHRVLSNFEQSGELDRLSLIDAISSFGGASAAALKSVLDDPVTREAWLSLSVAQPKLKSAILVSVVDRTLNPLPQVDAAGDSVVPKVSNQLGMKLFLSLGQVNGSEDATELVLS